MSKSIECLGAGFADEIKHLAQIDQLSGLVPPLLFALVAGKELDFAPVGKAVLDLDYVVNTALGTIHLREILPSCGASTGNVGRFGSRFEFATSCLLIAAY
jgi:hypothetical protein